MSYRTTLSVIHSHSDSAVVGRVGAYQRFVNHTLAGMPADIRFFTIGLVFFFFSRNTSKPDDGRQLPESESHRSSWGGNGAETANPEYDCASEN